MSPRPRILTKTHGFGRAFLFGSPPIIQVGDHAAARARIGDTPEPAAAGVQACADRIEGQPLVATPKHTGAYSYAEDGRRFWAKVAYQF